MGTEIITYCFDLEKSKKLEQERGVSFERVIQCIQENRLLDIREHPNQAKYPNQRILPAYPVAVQS